MLRSVISHLTASIMAIVDLSGKSLLVTRLESRDVRTANASVHRC